MTIVIENGCIITFALFHAQCQFKHGFRFLEEENNKIKHYKWLPFISMRVISFKMCLIWQRLGSKQRFPGFNGRVKLEYDLLISKTKRIAEQWTLFWRSFKGNPQKLWKTPYHLTSITKSAQLRILNRCVWDVLVYEEMIFIYVKFKCIIVGKLLQLCHDGNYGRLSGLKLLCDFYPCWIANNQHEFFVVWHF